VPPSGDRAHCRDHFAVMVGTQLKSVGECSGSFKKIVRIVLRLELLEPSIVRPVRGGHRISRLIIIQAIHIATGSGIGGASSAWPLLPR
jgi:hypothetical protein